MTNKIDWQYLRPALIVVALSLLFSVLLVFLGRDYRADMSALYQLKLSAYSEVERQLDEVRHDKELIARYLTPFNQLVRSGLFDQKQRVEWVDAVNAARAKMKLPLVRYQIAAQVPYLADYLTDEGYVRVMASEVKLEAGLLHEGDLVDLFNWMERYAPGQLHLSHCEMKRAEEVFGYYADRPNLKLMCDLQWFTIEPLDEEDNGVG